MRKEGSGTRMAERNFFKKLKFRPDLRLELGSKEAITESVAGVLGSAVISSHALRGNAKEHGASVIHVEGSPVQSHWHWHVFSLRDKSSYRLPSFSEHIHYHA